MHGANVVAGYGFADTGGPHVVRSHTGSKHIARSSRIERYRGTGARAPDVRFGTTKPCVRAAASGAPRAIGCEAIRRQAIRLGHDHVERGRLLRLLRRRCRMAVRPGFGQGNRALRFFCRPMAAACRPRRDRTVECEIPRSDIRDWRCGTHACRVRAAARRSRRDGGQSNVVGASRARKARSSGGSHFSVRPPRTSRCARSPRGHQQADDGPQVLSERRAAPLWNLAHDLVHARFLVQCQENSEVIVAVAASTLARTPYSATKTRLKARIATGLPAASAGRR